MITASAGHFGPKTGANGFLDEGAENIKVTKRVTEILNKAGIKTHYIQDTVNKSKNANVNWLIAQHNKTSRQIDVQIHFNSSAGSHSKGIGTEVLVYDNNTLAGATAIANAIASVGFKNRGAKVRKDLGFLSRTTKPAYLIEVCFVNDSVDSAIYRRDFEKICQNIAKELAKLVGKSLSPTAPTPTPAPTPKEEIDVFKLTDTAREACREMIKRAVVEGHFTSKHEGVNLYTDEQLLNYALIYMNRKTKETCACKGGGACDCR